MFGRADLAKGWDTHTTEQGVAYYHNRVTGETTWQRPDCLPSPGGTEVETTLKDAGGGGAAAAAAAATAASSAGTASSGETDNIGGWEAVWSDQHQMYYYCNRATGEAQWENPAPRQTNSDRGPPPPYSPTLEAQQHGNTRSAAAAAAAAAGSPPPYSSGASEESPAATAAVIAMAGAGAEPRTAAPAAAPAPAPAAAAAAGATRVAVLERPPSTEKEGSALRDALRRRQESFRRLEDVRAGARARLAALKAETEARRAAKSALKAKGDDGVKVPAAPSMDAPKAAADDGGGGNVNSATGSPRIAIASVSSSVGSASDWSASLVEDGTGSAASFVSSSSGLGSSGSAVAAEQGGGEGGGGASPSYAAGFSPLASTVVPPSPVGFPPPTAAAVAARASRGETEAARGEAPTSDSRNGDNSPVGALPGEEGGGGHLTDGGGHNTGSGVRLARPTNKRRQVPARKTNTQEAIAAAAAAAAGMMPGGDEKEEEAATAVAVAPPLRPPPQRGSTLPDSSAKLNDVDGFKALWRETVKVRSVQSFDSSGSSVSAAAAARLKDVEGFKALLRESAKARGVEDVSGSIDGSSTGGGVGGVGGSTGGLEGADGDQFASGLAAATAAAAAAAAAATAAAAAAAASAAAAATAAPAVEGGGSPRASDHGEMEEEEEGEEVQHGWDEVDLSGKGVRDEISAIMSLGTTAKNYNQDPTNGAAPALSAAATTREGGGPAGGTGQDRRASATEGAGVDGGITSAASKAPPIGVSNVSGGGGGGGDGKPQPRPSLSLDNLTEALGCAIDIAQVTDEEAGTESDSSAGERESELASSPQASPPTAVLGHEAARPPPARGRAAAAAPTGAGGPGGGGRKRTPGTPADHPSGGPRTPPPPYQEGVGEQPAAAGATSSAITAAAAAVSAYFAANSSSDDPEAALGNASRRVSRLRELLGSVGEADAWSRLLNADGHLGCRRLADLALAGHSAAAAAAAKPPAAGPQAATAAAPAPGVDTRRCRLLCAGALECLAICGKISPGMWADLSKPDQGEENGGESSRLSRLLSLCVALSGSQEAASAAKTGLNEHEYFFGKGSEGQGTGGEDEGEEQEPDLPAVGLTLVYEILTGVCKDRVEAFRCWGGMSNLVESLLGLIANQDREEGSYMGATRCLLAANHPFLRHRSPQATSAAAAAAAAAVDPATAVEVDGDNAAASVVLPALLDHLARHEVQGAVLHIFNEEGYPNGDAELARLCSVFCSDAFAKDRREDLFYVNDVKVMVDIILRELYNLPADDGLRADYLELLRRLLERSEWSTRGARYREVDIQRAVGFRA